MTDERPPRPPRRFSLTLYLLIVFALSWPAQIIGAACAANLRELYIANAVSMVLVGVATFICARFVFRDGLSGAGWRWGRARWYLLALGVPILLWAVPTLRDIKVGSLELPDALTREQLGWIFILLFVTIIPAFGEEIGWRGYMLPRMAAHRSPRKAVFLHGVIWWAWHLPVLVGMGVHVGYSVSAEGTGPSSIILYAILIPVAAAVPATLHGIFIAWLWHRSRSIAIATVYHTAYDGIRDSIQTTIGEGSSTSLIATAVLSLLGLLCLIFGKWEGLSADHTAPAPAVE